MNVAPSLLNRVPCLHPSTHLLIGYVYQVTLGCITGLHSDCHPVMHSPWELTQLRKSSFVNIHACLQVKVVACQPSWNFSMPRLVTGLRVTVLPVTALAVTAILFFKSYRVDRHRAICVSLEYKNSSSSGSSEGDIKSDDKIPGKGEPRVPDLPSLRLEVAPCRRRTWSARPNPQVQRAEGSCGRHYGALGAQSSARPCGDVCWACRNHTSTVEGCETCLRLIDAVSLRGAG